MRKRTKNKKQYKEEDFISLTKWCPEWRKIYSDLYYRYKEGIIEDSQYELFTKMRNQSAPNKPRTLNNDKFPPIDNNKKKKIMTEPIVITFD
tara:strand:+ start:85 stop:360 length:276 start_codon:yes stop_codon:yes gene_type:complete